MVSKSDKRIDIHLDIESENFIRDLRAALGMKPGDKLRAAYPIFERSDTVIISYVPNTEQEYDALCLMSDESLKKIGCQVWEDNRFWTHWLYPVQWYEDIPDGYEVTTIAGQKEIFMLGKTSCDARNSALGYGFIKQNKG